METTSRQETQMAPEGAKGNGAYTYIAKMSDRISTGSTVGYSVGNSHYPCFRLVRMLKLPGRLS
jgi:hypothetical protein